VRRLAAFALVFGAAAAADQQLLSKHLDQWGIDAAYAGSQKCLSCTPGLSPVSFSERAIAPASRRA
jgi:hypothetical protein